MGDNGPMKQEIPGSGYSEWLFRGTKGQALEGVQHMRMRDKFPDWQPARGMPYEDVENLRPETKKMVETWLKIYGDAKDVVLGVESAGN